MAVTLCAGQQAAGCAVGDGMEQRDGNQAPEADAPGPGDEPAAVAPRRPFWTIPTYRFAVLYGLVLVGIALAYPRFLAEFGPTVRQLEAATATVVYHVLDVFSSEARLLNERGVSFGGFPL